MKVLYISRLEGHEWQGPTSSVPMQILHQSKVDDVLWVNLCASLRKEWKEFPYYIESDAAMRFSFKDLPTIFRNPDIVVFEGVYEYPFLKIVSELWALNIPYVVVPRSALTSDAQRKKKVKKWIGNILFFNRFVKRAAAVHYLTLSEKIDSQKWKTDSFIVPNGIHPMYAVKSSFSKNGRLIWSFVGRIEKYQKGLDLLLDACAMVSQELRGGGVEIHLYGPDREGSFSDLSSEIMKYHLTDILFLHDGIFGDEKEKVLLESDAFIMTSRFEGLPMGMIEALAYGLPALATKGTNLAEEIKNSDAGWVSGNTAEDIARMLKDAIAERHKYNEKSKNAIELSKTYNWNNIAEKTHDEYLELINRDIKK